ncbi:MAG: DNA-deoxyinosine glycosylase [Oscillospiraceae bacterium]|nr:DNA-deoxyinosine glycosylase [Oscillospiraceae bacterium]
MEVLTPKSFPPIFDANSRLLILGTMPSVKSREVGFYYSHPQNRFWRVLAASLMKPLPQTVEEKTQLLLMHKIALWDVLESCEITGSADVSIREPVYNDVAELINKTQIEKILCNGTKAYKLCLNIKLPLPVAYMPSTSPANAVWSLEKLIMKWKSEVPPCSI